MFGRVLLTFVCLIIGISLVLPVVPLPAGAPGVPTPGNPPMIADRDAPCCVERTVVGPAHAGCQPACPCGVLLTVWLAAPDSLRGATLHLLVRPLPPDAVSCPDPQPPKLSLI